MPVGPLGLDSLEASDPLILHRGGERGMMDRSGDLGSCETSIKVKKYSNENRQRQRTTRRILSETSL